MYHIIVSYEEFLEDRLWATLEVSELGNEMRTGYHGENELTRLWIIRG